MSSHTILVIDGDSKNLQILKESLEKADFQVITSNNGNDAWTSIQSEKIDLIVSEVDIPGIDGFQFLEKLQKDPVGASIPLVFLTNRRNLEDRIRSLRSGVKDYMIKPLHVKEVIARLQMILRRIERMKTEETDFAKKEVGRLEEQNVEHLIEHYGTERKTGVLTIYDENNHSGEIYFRDGAVVNARLGNFKAEKAVYQMLPWKAGHFVMMLQDVSVKEEITVSNLGLLLQGFKRLQDREKLIKQLPSLDVIFVKAPLFEKVLQKKKISGDALKFISLFDGNRKVTDIITESIYDDIKTLERILKLYQQGFIKPLGGEQVGRVPRTRDVSVDRPPRRTAAESPRPEPREPEPPRPTPPQTQPESVAPAPEPEYETQNDKTRPQPPDPEVEFPASFAEIENPSPNAEPAEDRDANSHSQPPSAPEEPPEDESVPSQEPAAVEMSESESDLNAVNGKTLPAPRHEDKDGNHGPASGIIDDLLQSQGRSKGHLAVISSNNEHRRELIATLTNGHYVAKSIDSDSGPTIEVARLQTASRKTFEIVGVSTEKRFVQMLDQLSSSLMGYLLLVVADKSTNFGYLGYLVNSLKNKFAVPNVVTVYHPPDSKPVPLDFIRYSLNLDDDEQIVELDSLDIESLQDLLKQLQPPTTKQQRATSSVVQ